ncbi:MAG: septation protein A [Gammaproteobacteria bacterium]|nr:septation protein A [Gammaproteobacteria bacterium]
MQLLFDFFPVVAFFIAFKLYDMFVATAVIIVAAVLQIAIHWLWKRSFNRMHIVSALLILIFGGITLTFRNELFIQWKPTVLYWLFAAVFLASQYVGGKPIVQRIMQEVVQLEARQWRKLNLMWVVFFAVLGALNLYVVYQFTEDTWVNFKLFGLLGLTLAFAMLQGIWLARKAAASSTESRQDV